MYKVANKFLLAGDKFMPELHLKQPGLLIVLVGRLLNIMKRYKNSKIHAI